MPEGWIKLYRKILYSSIFKKPSEYLKIFIYILCKVNHSNGLFAKGANFFNFQEEIRNIPGVSLNQVYGFIRWAKKDGIITTQKTTRGVIIKLNQWELYQAAKDGEIQNTSQDGTKTTARVEQISSNTINKKEKNNKNERSFQLYVN